MARRTSRGLADAGQQLAERLAYRPREVVVVALLAAGLFGGFAIDRWRARHPAIAERLEAEPVRLTSSAALPTVPRPRARPALARCDEPGIPAPVSHGLDADPAPPHLDLNRATAGELARVAGISWRLAARIVAARDGLERRNGRRMTPDEAGLAPRPSPASPDSADEEAASPRSETESP
jgi:Helix-hairpin-helix motif